MSSTPPPNRHTPLTPHHTPTPPSAELTNPRQALHATVARRFTLGRPIGHGGQGQVFLARDLFTNKDVAVKLFNRSDRAALWKTRQEIMALRLLNLPGVVRFLEDGLHGNRCYLAMDLIQGQPFSWSGAARPRWDEIEGITLQVLDTLARIHHAGVLHRDIKPENILIHDGEATIVDFGVSDQHTLTARGHGPAGTPEYIAPEQFSPGVMGPGTDLYALGTALYITLSGQRPFSPTELLPLLEAKLTQAPAPLRERCPALPRHVADTIDAMMARHIQDRPRSADEVIDALRGRAHTLTPAPAARAQDAAALMPLFEGNERILRQRSTAADLLWRRTAGAPARVLEELNTWTARRYVLERGPHRRLLEEWIGRLEAHIPLFLTRAPLADPRLRDLSSESLQLLGAAGLAWPACRDEVLRAALPLSDAQFEGALQALIDRALLVYLPDTAQYLPLLSPDLGALWDHHARFHLHQRLIQAMRPGEPGRLLHRLCFSQPEDCLYEIEACANDLEALADQTALFELFVTGLPVIIEQIAHPKARDLLDRWLDHAISSNHTKHINLYLREIGRLLEHRADLQPLHDLALACSLTRETGGERALDELARIQTDEPAQESLRLALEVFAHRRHPVEQQQAALDRYERWAAARAPHDPRTTARRLQLKGMIAYRAHDFHAAADAFKALAAVSQGQDLFLALMNHQSALMETGDLERAQEALQQLQARLRRSRSSYLLVRLLYFERALAYRRAQPLPMDEEFLSLAHDTQSILLESLAYSTEAAFSWRCGQRDRARDLALEAAELWARGDNPEVAALYQSLAIACGAPVHLERWQHLCQIRRERPRLLLQSLALVHGHIPCEAWPAGWEAARAAWASATPDSPHRFEILTRAEIEAALSLVQPLVLIT
jgi:hypothetical protein